MTALTYRSHQFAFPVQWSANPFAVFNNPADFGRAYRINTQDALFSDPRNVARFVELGPSSVLTNMARRTRDLKYATRDTVLNIDRQFLSCTKDQGKLGFHYDPPNEIEDVQETEATSTSALPESGSNHRVERQLDFAVDEIDVPDVKTTAIERIQAMVACKIKKGLDAVPATKSIKDLSSGNIYMSCCLVQSTLMIPQAGRLCRMN